jgi:hypothetical protein
MIVQTFAFAIPAFSEYYESGVLGLKEFHKKIGIFNSLGIIPIDLLWIIGFKFYMNQSIVYIECSSI